MSRLDGVFSIKKKYTNRHKILEVLQQQQLQDNYSPTESGQNYILLLAEVAKRAKISEKEFWEQVDFLLLEKEIFNTDIQFTDAYIIEQVGTKAYHDKKYLQAGKKEWKDNFSEKLKTFSTIVLLMIAVSTFIINIIATNNNRKEIEKLKTDVEVIQKSLKVQ